MAKISVTIEGLSEFASAIKKEPTVAVNELSKAVAKSIIQIHREAVLEAPVNKQPGEKGNLRKQIRSGMISKLSGAVISNANYSAAVHEGSRPHIIQSTGPWHLRNKRTGQVFGRIVHHPGTRPNPFFIRAIQKSSKKVEGFFELAMTNLLKSLT